MIQRASVAITYLSYCSQCNFSQMQNVSVVSVFKKSCFFEKDGSCNVITALLSLLNILCFPFPIAGKEYLEGFGKYLSRFEQKS